MENEPDVSTKRIQDPLSLLKSLEDERVDLELTDCEKMQCLDSPKRDTNDINMLE